MKKRLIVIALIFFCFALCVQAQTQVEDKDARAGILMIGTEIGSIKTDINKLIKKTDVKKKGTVNPGLSKKLFLEYFGDSQRQDLVYKAKVAGFSDAESDKLFDKALAEKKEIGGPKALANFYATLDSKRKVLFARQFVEEKPNVNKNWGNSIIVDPLAPAPTYEKPTEKAVEKTVEVGLQQTENLLGKLQASDLSKVEELGQKFDQECKQRVAEQEKKEKEKSSQTEIRAGTQNKKQKTSYFMGTVVAYGEEKEKKK